MAKYRLGIISLESTKRYITIFFICGWVLPKITLVGFNIGIQDLAALFLIFFGFKIDISILKFFVADLIFSFFFFLVGAIYLFKGDLESFLIGFRTLLFVLAVLSFASFNFNRLYEILKLTIFLNLSFVSISVLRILLNILTNPFDILNFLYGSDSYRVRAPFEPEGSASSQVPVGYMLALILCTPIVVNSNLKKIMFMLGAVATTSRASILSIIIVFAKKISFKNISVLFSGLGLVLLAYISYLKSFTANDGQLDGSAGKRIELYSNSINIMFNNPAAFLSGFGLSSKALALATSEGFYESFVVNSFMQGGIILLILSIWILLKTFYYDYKYKIYSISIVVFLGNAIGGSNYFSMYAYPLMGLIVFLAFKSQNTN